MIADLGVSASVFSVPCASVQEKAPSVLLSPAPPEEFWVDKGVYYASVGMSGRKVTIALHGVSNDQQAASAVLEFRRKFGADPIRQSPAESM